MALGDCLLYFVKVLETLWQKRMLRKDVIYFLFIFLLFCIRVFQFLGENGCLETDKANIRPKTEKS